MAKIKVDIDELSEKLEAMKEEDYVTVELEIIEDDYANELSLSAVSFEESDPVGFGTLSEIDDELM